MSDFYVYEHWRPDIEQCFYVGKGRGRRAYTLASGRSRPHQYVRLKLLRLGYEIDVRIIKSGLSEAEAFEAERLCISYWRLSGARLVNLTDGGEGSSGFKRSRETIERHRQLLKGRKLTEEHKRKIAAAHIGKVGKDRGKPKPSKNPAQKSARLSAALKGRSCWNKGKTNIYSAEARAKMSAAAKMRRKSKVADGLCV